MYTLRCEQPPVAGARAAGGSRSDSFGNSGRRDIVAALYGGAVAGTAISTNFGLDHRLENEKEESV